MCTVFFPSGQQVTEQLFGRHSTAILQGMWVIALILVGLLGVIQISLTLVFYHDLAVMSWIGPGTTIAKLSLMQIGAGLVGVFVFVGELAYGRRERWGY